jgi:prepilin-type N-terminal cleavage/methylation domain-containing protein
VMLARPSPSFALFPPLVVFFSEPQRAERTRRKRRRAGFTLIEVVLAMLVLLIGMSAILGLLSFGAALSRTASLRSGASGSIDAVVADLEESLFPLQLDELGDEIAGEPRDVKDHEIPGYPGLLYSTQSTPNPENPLEYKVEVEMKWAVGGTTRTKRFTTLLLREVPFGERLRSRIIEGKKPEKQ